MIITDPTTIPTTEDAAPSEYRAASIRYLEVITIAATFIAESDSPHVQAWAVVYALGLPCAEGVSMSDRAGQIGVSVAALSKQVKKFAALSDIEPSAYCYSKRLTP